MFSMLASAWALTLVSSSPFHVASALNLKEPQPAGATPANATAPQPGADPLARLRELPNETKRGDAELLMTFETCHGALNQHVSLVHGFAVATILNATVKLPLVESSLGGDGAPRWVDFSSIYDQDGLAARLEGMVQIVDHLSSDNDQNMDFDLHPGRDVYNEHGPLASWKQVRESYKKQGKRVIRFGCMYNALNAVGNKEAIDLIWKISDALRFIPPFEAMKDAVVSRIRAHSPTGHFTALQLRVEQDWLDFCPSYKESDNCLGNEDVLHSVLAIERVPTTDPVYVMTGLPFEALEHDRRFATMLRMYTVVAKDKAWPSTFQPFAENATEDILSLIDFAIGREADRFIGNSVSTMGALIELGRKKKNSFSAFHYNGGPIPLAKTMPINPGDLDTGDYEQDEMAKPIKWVFTLAAGVSNTTIFRMKVAVESALANTTLMPYCIYLPAGWEHGGGSTPDETESWLLKRGVVVIRHIPAWAGKLSKVLDGSELTMPPETMFSLFLRFDIPLVGFTDRYVLYSDPDVVFLRNVQYGDLGGGGKPALITMGADTKSAGDKARGSAGVIFLDTSKLRQTHTEFMNWIFESPYIQKKMVTRGATPVKDAYNLYYSKEIKLVARPAFNWKVSWATSEEEFSRIAILHLHASESTGHTQELLSTGDTSKQRVDARFPSDCRLKAHMCQRLVAMWNDVAGCVLGGVPCSPSPPRLPELQAPVGLIGAARGEERPA